MNTAAFHDITYGLYIICALDSEGRKVGCVANTFSQVANDPLCVSVSLNKDCITSQAIQQTRRFTASVLTVNATMELIGRFGFNSSYNIDKFEGIPYELDGEGVPYITGDAVNSHFSTDVDQVIDVGSHLIIIGRAVDAAINSDAESLTYAYYHSVLKGKTPPKAVSYLEEEIAEEAAEAVDGAIAEAEGAAVPRTGWRCTLCGYIEEGYPDGLPEDYRCPWCGAGPEMFERIEL